MCNHRGMETLTTQEIIDAQLTDWRKLAQGLHARFLTDNFSSATAFLSAIAEVAGPADHFPEVRLTRQWVELKLTTHQIGRAHV